MTRVLFLWTCPPHLSASEVEGWARDELATVVDLPQVRSADLVALRCGSERLGCPHDWMLELRLAPGARAAECVAAAADWLGDMRLLGMSPAVAVADGHERLTERS